MENSGKLFELDLVYEIKASAIQCQNLRVNASKISTKITAKGQQNGYKLRPRTMGKIQGC